MYKKSRILICVVAFIFSGCASLPWSPGHNMIGKVRKIETKKITDAAFKTKNLSFKIVDSKTIVISGEIIDPTLTFTTITKEEQFRALGAWGTRNKWSPTGRRFPKYEEKERWPLSLLRIHYMSNRASATKAVVDSNGNFEATIKANDFNYFVRPKRRKYYKLYSKEKMIEVGATHKAYDKWHSEWANIGTAKIYFFKEDVEKMKEFGRNLVRGNFSISPVNIEFREQITRREISPEIIMTPVDAPTKKNHINSFFPLLRKEFDGNSRFIEFGMKGVKSQFNRYRNVAWANERRKEIAQSIMFNGIVGYKYKIETIHGEYYYFKGFLSPNSSSPIKKTILLVEKGDKIRVQEVREGEGGSMIDQ